LARGLKALSGVSNDVDDVVHLYDRFERDAKDVDWIGELSKSGRWCIVSSDHFKKHHRAEIEALRRGGHLVFVLEKQWSGQVYWSKAERFVAWWPQMIATAQLVDSGMLSVPFAHRTGAKFKPMRL
jgi:hypothetical protein